MKPQTCQNCGHKVCECSWSPLDNTIEPKIESPNEDEKANCYALKSTSNKRDGNLRDTLSDKIIKADNKEKNNGFFWEKDVKAAVKELKENLIDSFSVIREDNNYLIQELNDALKNIFGEKLI